MPEKVTPWGQYGGYGGGGSPTNPNPVVNCYGNYGVGTNTFNVYTVQEVDETITELRNADDGKAAKAELDQLTAQWAAFQNQIFTAFQSTVADSLGIEQSKAIQAKVKADLKADPDFRQEMKEEIMLELLADPSFIAQIMAKLPPSP